MRRLGLLVLLTATATAGCTSRDAEVSRYVAARATYQHAFDSLWRPSADQALKVNNAWVTEYGPVLRHIVGPLELPALSDSVKTNIGSMSGNYEADALPDGFVYHATDGVDIFVTDTTVFRAWALQRRRSDAGVDSILRIPSVFAKVFDTGAAARRCTLVPGIQHALSAMTIEYSQDPGSACLPNVVVVSMTVGHRLLVTQQSIPAPAKSDSGQIAGMARALVARLTGDAH